MSKESYARGFCKVAEAHGIDPVALAKYAAEKGPKYKTDGYAPAVVARLGTKYPIRYAPKFGPGLDFAYTYADGPFARSEDARFDNRDPDHIDLDLFKRLGVDKYLNWFLAHQKARQEVADAAKPYDGNKSVYRNPKMPDLGKIYHRSMLNSTGVVNQASAPSN